LKRRKLALDFRFPGEGKENGREESRERGERA
jgi:hypothetical protein